MSGYGGVSADLAAVEGRKHMNMDKVMTVICFILLLIIVVIPIFMIIYNAFFYEGKLEDTVKNCCESCTKRAYELSK